MQASFKLLPASWHIVILLFFTILLGSQYVESDSVTIDQVKNLVNAACRYGQTYLQNDQRLRKRFYNEKVDTVDRTESTYQLTLFSQPSRKAKNMAKYALLSIAAGKRLQYLSKKSIKDLMKSPLFRKVWRGIMAKECSLTDEPKCDNSAKYRTLDGSCNNPDNPTWGMAVRAQARYLSSEYSDGFDSPRTKGKNDQPLPSARLVSNNVFKAGVNPILDHKLTVMHMSYGQFLDHDFILTPVSTGEDDANIECCNSKSKGENRDECFPIDIPEGDEFFKGKTCMNFVRSEPAQTDCIPGPREQLNEVTSYLDASNVYGSSLEKMHELREGKGGLLRLDKYGRLPKRKKSNCFKDVSTDKCQDAGDQRVNVVPNLGAVHTLWANEHNRIAKRLAELNTFWDDDRIFFEARKIVIAEMQHITYNEYLPPIISKHYMDSFRLFSKRKGFFKGYKKYMNPTITNVFGVAAFRFGHSQIPNKQAIFSKFRDVEIERNIEKTFHRPNMCLLNKGQGCEGILIWLATEPATETDRFFEDGVRDKLFPDKKGNSFDLPAINTQRGRDHGIPGYNKWRKWCGLPKARHFGPVPGGLGDHSVSAAAALASVYNCTDDIDLFPGAISETPVPGGIVGPTFACIISKQFRALKYGDRFWYENPGKTGFSKEQLNEIRKISLSKVLCENTDISKMQPNSFKIESSRNPLKKCCQIPGINLRYWVENTHNNMYSNT